MRVDTNHRFCGEVYYHHAVVTDAKTDRHGANITDGDALRGPDPVDRSAAAEVGGAELTSVCVSEGLDKV